MIWSSEDTKQNILKKTYQCAQKTKQIFGNMNVERKKERGKEEENSTGWDHMGHM